MAFRSGVAQLQDGRAIAAEVSFREALKVDPAHVSARQALLGLLLDGGRNDEAEKLLRQIMDEARDTEDVLTAFNQLNMITEQIEVLKGQIKYYEESAALSAISVELISNEAVQPIKIGPWEPVGVAKQAIEALIKALQGILEAVIWLALYVLPIVLVIAVPLWLVGRGLRGWLARRKNASPRRRK